MLKKEVMDYQTDIDKVEGRVVEDIINDVETTYFPSSPPPLPKTEEQNDFDKKEENFNFFKDNFCRL